MRKQIPRSACVSAISVHGLRLWLSKSLEILQSVSVKRGNRRRIALPTHCVLKLRNCEASKHSTSVTDVLPDMAYKQSYSDYVLSAPRMRN